MTPEHSSGLLLAASGIQHRVPRRTISLHSEPFTVYRTNEGPKPFYFPIIGPIGTRYTRAYPMRKVAGEGQAFKNKFLGL